jgi:hypothetical protein
MFANSYSPRLQCYYIFYDERMGIISEISNHGPHVSIALRHFIIHILVLTIIPNSLFHTLKSLHIFCAEFKCFLHYVPLTHPSFGPCHVANKSIQLLHVYFSMGYIHQVCIGWATKLYLHH